MKDITNIIRNWISNNGLVHSGQLITTTTAYVSLNSSFIVKVSTTDYFVYLINKYDLVNYLSTSNEFKFILETLIDEVIKNDPKKLNSFIPEIVIYVNGV